MNPSGTIFLVPGLIRSGTDRPRHVVLLLEAGNKRTQPQDITRAIDRWNDW